MEWEFLTGTLIRWAHLVSGIMWVGTLYSLALIVGPSLQGLEPPLRSRVARSIMPRALLWLRWASMTTVLLGTALFTWEYHRVSDGFGNNANLIVDDRITDRGWFIMSGISVGIVLWFMAWFMIGPAWAAILRRLSAGNPLDELRLAVVSGRTRFAFLLSGPLLLFMVAPQNYLGEYSTLSVSAILSLGVAIMGLLLFLGGRLPLLDDPV